MTKNISYSMNKAFNDTVRFKHLIPYRIRRFQKYENDEWYYSEYWGKYFRVINARYSGGNLIDVYVKDEDDMYSLLSSELCFGEDYLLEKDFNLLCNNSIINDGRSHFGAEIVYWFFTNNIDCFNIKHKGFWKFVDRYSAHRISDDNKYFISAEIGDNGNYINCRMIRDNSEDLKRRYKISKQYRRKDNEFMKRQKEKDMKKIRDIKAKRLQQD